MTYGEKYQELVELSHSDNPEIRENADAWLVSIGLQDAAELKVKETDRIETVTDNLKAMGADVTPTDDGMIIHGGNPLHGTSIHTLLDHRIAMAFSIAALVAEGNTKILDSKCVDVSYPTFYDTFEALL